MKKSIKIGHGYDVHKFADGRKLVLGGVTVPYERGLLGHSDADVLTHALADAILGALGEGDIGKHFPDNDPKYEGIDSLILLREVNSLARERGYHVVNADCTVIAQTPKLAKHIDEMRKKLAECVDCDASDVNVKATTEEHLGFTGRLEGISAHAVVLLCAE